MMKTKILLIPAFALLLSLVSCEDQQTTTVSKSLWGVSPLSLQVEVRHDCDVSSGPTTNDESPLPRGGGGQFWAFDLEARGLRWPLASRRRSSCCKRLS